MIHDCMPCDPIQVQRHGGTTVAKKAAFKVCDYSADIHVVKRLMVNYFTSRQYLN